VGDAEGDDRAEAHGEGDEAVQLDPGHDPRGEQQQHRDGRHPDAHGPKQRVEARKTFGGQTGG
jgi:hypothetical protein